MARPQTILASVLILLLAISFPSILQTHMFSRIRQAFQSTAAPVILSAPTSPTTPTAQAAQASLRTMSTANGASERPEVATVASGCFWGTEHIFRKHFDGKGLVDAKVGFIGGKKDSVNPSYEQVCTGHTGHAEATQLHYDPVSPFCSFLATPRIGTYASPRRAPLQSKVSYAELVEFFYRSHDPTQLNAQGNDRGTQYRSALFPHSSEQEETARKVTSEVQEKHFTPKGKKIVTTIEPAR